jgi:hypothetical protein
MADLHFDTVGAGSTAGGAYAYAADTTVVITNPGSQTVYVGTEAVMTVNPTAGFPILPHSTVELPTGDTPFALYFGSSTDALSDKGVWIAGLR